MIQRGYGFRFEDFFGLEAQEFLEGVAVIAVGHVDAALEAGEVVGVLAEGLRKGGAVDHLTAFLPEFGFNSAEAAEQPFGIDEGVDEHALLGGGGVKAIVIFPFEAIEVGRGFAEDDLRFGVDA